MKELRGLLLAVGAPIAVIALLVSLVTSGFEDILKIVGIYAGLVAYVVMGSVAIVSYFKTRKQKKMPNL